MTKEELTELLSSLMLKMCSHLSGRNNRELEQQRAVDVGMGIVRPNGKCKLVFKCKDHH
jgi:hypothetical protein